MLMDAWGIEGSGAGTDGHFSSLEVRQEGFPFVVGWRAVFLAWAHGAAAGDERAVRVDRLGGVDSFVAHRGGDVRVSTDDLCDVWWQAVEDGVGDEHPTEVVRGEVQRLAGGVGQSARGPSPGEPLVDRHG